MNEIQLAWLGILSWVCGYMIGRLHEHVSHVKKGDFIEGRGNYPGEPGYKRKAF